MVLCYVICEQAHEDSVSRFRRYAGDSADFWSLPGVGPRPGREHGHIGEAIILCNYMMQECVVASSNVG